MLYFTHMFFFFKEAYSWSLMNSSSGMPLTVGCAPGAEVGIENQFVFLFLFINEANALLLEAL